MTTFVRKKIVGYSCGLLAAFFWGVHSVMIRFMTGEGISPFFNSRDETLYWHRHVACHFGYKLPNQKKTGFR